jgi:hypothetical protein
LPIGDALAEQAVFVVGFRHACNRSFIDQATDGLAFSSAQHFGRRAVSSSVRGRQEGRIIDFADMFTLLGGCSKT